jgi:hypothetical protein
MLALKLVHLIEAHSDKLAANLTARVKNSPRTKTFASVPDLELHQRVYEIYRHLGEWLLDKTESELESFYTALGEHRASQGVAVSDFVWALVITKETLWEFLRSGAMADKAMELFGELELVLSLDQFFDRATFFGLRGFELYAAKAAQGAKVKSAAAIDAPAGEPSRATRISWLESCALRS